MTEHTRFAETFRAQHLSPCSGHDCRCDLLAPPERELRSVGFCAELARFYAGQMHDGLVMSGDAKIDWVFTQVYDLHKGRLQGLDGKFLDLTGDHLATTEAFDALFGADARRFMARFIARADRPFKYRLQRRCLFAVLILHYARAIHLCNAAGGCARPAQNPPKPRQD